MNKNKIVRDTFFLTAADFAMQGLALLLNVFITRKLGSAAVGAISLMGTFLTFTGIISSGNVYLCSSRLISEEIGRSHGNPNKIYRYSLIYSLPLCILISGTIFAMSGSISENILKTPELTMPVRIMSLILPVNTLCCTLRGYFSAYRNVVFGAVGSAVEFLVKSGMFAMFAEFYVCSGKISVYMAFALSMAAGQLSGLIYLMICHAKFRRKYSEKASIGFKCFLLTSIPIMLNSVVTSVLSSVNDALVPLTLKQYGNSTEEALSQFGIFEAIIIPALFFPSGILCSLSAILIPELSRERGAENMQKTARLTNKVLRQTFSFSIFAASIFLCYGNEIGFLMSGESFAGKILKILAPAVPFIYLEIILEGILKGMGKHSFSSLNYLVEYTIRISVLLICVPLFGFYGIVMSYLASNIICNTSRIIKIVRVTGIKFSFSDNIITPVISAVCSMQLVSIAEKPVHLEHISIAIEPVIFTLLSGLLYLLIQNLIHKITDTNINDTASMARVNHKIKSSLNNC